MTFLRYNKLMKKGETKAGALNRLTDTIRTKKIQRDPHWKPRWCLVIVDEAHKLRNPFAYWSIGCAMVCQDAFRCIMATGTPYNNREQVRNPDDLVKMLFFIF